MKRFAPQRILAATDFSELSTGALRHAVMWARCYESALTVLHVQEPPPAWGDGYVGGYNLAGLVEAVWSAAAQELEQYVQQHVPPDVAVTRESLGGSPARVIEEFAEGGSVDLVVLGTHGRTGIRRLLMGSVAESALHLARQPTLIVRQLPARSNGRTAGTVSAGGEAPGLEPPPLKHILCPVNESGVGRAAFDHACSVAQIFGARLTAVSVIEPDQEYQAPGNLRHLEERLQTWVPARAEYEIQPVVRHGDAAEQVITLAREVSADLVVIGAQHRRFIDSTVLGVTTVRVTRHAPCPVLVVPRTSTG